MRQEQSTEKARVSQRDAINLYDKLSGMYNLFGHLAESKARNRSLELADVKSGQHVLEVAVGTGLAFVRVVKANPDGRNVGIDISQGMLSKAERRLRNAGLSNYELSVGSALAIQEGDGVFDLLLNSYMLDLMDEPDWSTVLKEFQNVWPTPTQRLLSAFEGVLPAVTVPFRGHSGFERKRPTKPSSRRRGRRG
jgi:ubiquinone/menaquinone biosynthesis C-methylase UbiE